MSKLLFIGLVAIRLLSALTDKGYIHPDEWFQNGEVVAGDVFNIETLRTWEFDPTNPSRSIVPLYLTSGLMWVAKLLGVKAPAASVLFLAQRISFSVISLFLDLCFYYLLPSSFNGQQKARALGLWASSGVLFSFQIRPFSNSTEAVILAGCLASLRGLSKSAFWSKDPKNVNQGNGQSVPQWTYLSIDLGVMLALGLFTRITFLSFALPTGIGFLYLAWHQASQGANKAGNLVLNILPATLSFAATSALCVCIDTAYFGTTPLSFSLQSLKITPLNLLRYNLSSSNLSQHGLHPRWLHFVVNLPMVVGGGVFGISIFALVKQFMAFGSSPNAASMLADEKITRFMQRVYLATIFIGTAIISILPHQEPRFVVPLVLPSMLIFTTTLPSLPRKLRRALIGCHVIQTIIIAVLFSVLHQAGLIPALFKLNDDLRAIAGPTRGLVATPAWFDTQSKSKVTMVFWKTYMPPRHLLLPPRESDHCTPASSAVFEVVDLMGSPMENVKSNLTALDSPDAVTLLVSPSYALKALQEQQGIASEPLYHFRPHVNMDDLGDAFQLGFREGFQLEVRKVVNL